MPEAVEFELIRVGLRWRDVPVSVPWRDVWVVVSCAGVDSPVRARTPESRARWESGWRVEHDLLAQLVNLTLLVNRNPKKPMPKLVEWPGHGSQAKSAGERARSGSGRVGSGLPVDELRARLGARFGSVVSE